MEYEYNNPSKNRAPYDPHVPLYHRHSPVTSQPPHVSSLYPNIGHPGHPVVPSGSASSRAPPPYHHPSSSSSPPSSGTGIRVQIKPEYRITPPPHLLPHMGDVPHSTFQFNFDFERKVLAEAEKENQNWSRFAMENIPSRPPETMPAATPAVDPVVNKYIASGLNREAVSLAVANFGDNPTKVREFVNGYTLLREMGFSSNNVGEALLMFDNDTDKAVAHFLNGSS